MDGRESRYQATAQRMDEALIALLEKKDLEYITVKELCAAAGVNRTTFYLHYETIGDLLAEAELYISERFHACFAQKTRALPGRIGEAALPDLVLITREYLVPYLTFIRENRHVYRAAYRSPGAMGALARYRYLREEILAPILRRFGVAEDRLDYWIDFHIEGIFAILRRWLATDCADSVEMIADVIEDCVRPMVR